MFEWVAATLLLMGSVAIIRSVILADLGDRAEARVGKAQSGGESFRKAA